MFVKGLVKMINTFNIFLKYMVGFLQIVLRSFKAKWLYHIVSTWHCFQTIPVGQLR